MGRLGIGAMLGLLGGNEKSVDAHNKAVGQTISDITIDSENLSIAFENGLRITIYDDGQYCCERRYMRTDDDIKYHIGAKFVKAEIRDAEETSVDEYGDEHEIQFLLVTTSRGVITVANHNEHNGCYGGFSMVIREDK